MLMTDPIIAVEPETLTDGSTVYDVTIWNGGEDVATFNCVDLRSAMKLQDQLKRHIELATSLTCELYHADHAVPQDDFTNLIA